MPVYIYLLYVSLLYVHFCAICLLFSKYFNAMLLNHINAEKADRNPSFPLVVFYSIQKKEKKKDCFSCLCLTCLLCWCARWRDALLKWVTQSEGLSEGDGRVWSVMIPLISRNSNWRTWIVALWNALSADCLQSLIKSMDKYVHFIEIIFKEKEN